MKIELLKITGQATASQAGTVRCELEQGYRYNSILMKFASAASVLTVNFPNDHYLKVNGSVQRVLTPTDLNLINALNNEPSATYGTAGTTPYSAYVPAATRYYLEHYFAEPWIKQFNTRQLYALDITDRDTGVIEVPFASVTPAPTVTFEADVTPLALLDQYGLPLNRANDRPTLVKYSTGAEATGAASIHLTKINKTFSRADVVQHLRFKDADQAITDVEVTVNDKLILHRSKEELDKETRSAGMNPVSGYLDIFPAATDDPRDGWIWGPGDKCDVKLTLAAAATTAVQYWVQRFGQTD